MSCNFVISISRILLLKLGWQINAANDIKNHRRRSSRLAAVMFPGTPCIKRKYIAEQNVQVSLPSQGIEFPPLTLISIS